jgi:hypothetical protein
MVTHLYTKTEYKDNSQIYNLQNEHPGVFSMVLQHHLLQAHVDNAILQSYNFQQST